MLFGCVLAGGRGERFWPLSREHRPKQMTNLTGEGTMLRLTVERILPAIPAERVLVITSEALVDRVRRDLDFLPGPNVIAEPVGRNSAPAIALAAKWCAHRDHQSSFLVAPSDHVVDGAAFLETLEEAAAFAGQEPALVTFGLKPTRPETGYGYIEIGEPIRGRLHRSRGFREKPDAETARAFLAEGRFLWNSGLFVWRSDAFLAAVRDHLPEVNRALEAVTFDRKGYVPAESLRRFYGACPSISVDYGVMEKAPNVVVCVSDFGWCDVGSWAALGEVLPVDDDGNIAIGNIQALHVRNTILYSDGPPLAVVGVEGLVVVRVGEVTMVCPKDRAELVKDLVRRLREIPEWRRYL